MCHPVFCPVGASSGGQAMMECQFGQSSLDSGMVQAYCPWSLGRKYWFGAYFAEEETEAQGMG
jgi:hypothetical protein